MPVTVINGSQLDTRSLIQAERNEKALRRIQKKMMHARSTLDWSQSNNFLLFLKLYDISCNHTPAQLKKLIMEK